MESEVCQRSEEEEQAWRKNRDSHQWSKVVHLVQRVFTLGRLPHQSYLNTLVLIPKDLKSKTFRSNGLTDCIWKICGKIIADRINSEVEWHDALHGFWEGKGTGKETLEVKLFASLAQQRGSPVYQVFLDLEKPLILSIVNVYCGSCVVTESEHV